MSITPNELTDREVEILRLVATGASNKEIAARLSISLNTVKVHLRNIFSKINVVSRTEAAMFALKNGIAQQEEVRYSEDDGAASSLPAGAGAGVPAAGTLPSWLGTGGTVRRASLWLIGLGLIALLVVLSFQANRQRPQQVVAPASDPHKEWRALPDLPTPRTGLGVSVYEESIIAIGGKTAAGITGRVEKFTLSLGAWSALSPKNVAVTDIGAVAIAGKIYVPGGLLASGEPTDTLEIYDPKMDTWSESTPLPGAVSGYALAAFEGELYLFGGWDGNRYLDSVYAYDPETRRWQAKSPMSEGRAYASALLSADKIFLIGGFDGKSATDRCEIYYPSKDTIGSNPWETCTPMPDPRYRMGAASIAGMMFLLGGEAENGGHSQGLLEFFPPNYQWQTVLSPVSGDWVDAGLVSLGVNLFALGGSINDQPTGKAFVIQAMYSTALPVIR